ncbi:MAG: hypothetical protein K0Q50_225 [Vampirovibrio sp.]|jgi:hypothetical protein|nr:hypothetical protein [Vampirovibrio sp.]
MTDTISADQRVYRLKTDPVPFDKVKSGLKTGEVRTNDRDFQVGGRLVLEQYDRETGTYSGESVEWVISDVTDLEPYGCPGKVLLSFQTSQAEVERLREHNAELESQVIQMKDGFY